MKILKLPPVRILNEAFSYDPKSGELFWKERPLRHYSGKRAKRSWLRFNSTKAGKVAGHKHLVRNGTPHAIVVRGMFCGKDMWLLAHRIIYSLMGVIVPDGMVVDHKDRNPFNNRWHNLRLASSSQNSANSVGHRRHLPKGVSVQKGRYKAQICVDGKKRHIGMYSTPEEASAAYVTEAKVAWGNFVRPT